MSAKRLAALLAVAGGLAACTVGPNYHRPAIATPAAYLEGGQAGPAGDTVITPDTADLARWWTQFNDPLLTWLIGRALADNPNLQAAASRVREARQQEIIAGAAEYPSLNASANALTLNSNRASASGAPAQGVRPAACRSPAHTNLYSVGFDASWEVDLFGGTRRSLEAARDTTQAQAWAERDGEVSLTAEVANDYLTLRALQARIAVGKSELARQRRVGELVGARRREGFVTNLDVNQQTTVVATAAAQIPQLEAQARGQIHALGVLIGRSPEDLAPVLAVNGALPASPPTLPTGLPSELLRRRPDIREAERRLAASTARIGVQTANLYPRLNLIGLGSFAGNSPGSLFSSQNLSSIALGMATQPIFDAGRNRASLRAAREEATQSALTYRNAILAALRDVEDALARFRSEEARLISLRQSVTAARGSLGIAQDQYRTGFVSFINVYQAADRGAERRGSADAIAGPSLDRSGGAVQGAWRRLGAGDRGATGRMRTSLSPEFGCNFPGPIVF